jgi:hypothetical protein
MRTPGCQWPPNSYPPKPCPLPSHHHAAACVHHARPRKRCRWVRAHRYAQRRAGATAACCRSGDGRQGRVPEHRRAAGGAAPRNADGARAEDLAVQRGHGHLRGRTLHVLDKAAAWGWAAGARRGAGAARLGFKGGEAMLGLGPAPWQARCSQAGFQLNCPDLSTIEPLPACLPNLAYVARRGHLAA